jgi:hypothetical protein
MTEVSRMVSGADMAFVRDSAALVFVSDSDGVYKVEHERVWKPGEKPLRPSVVFAEAMAEVEAYEAESFCCDDHYLATVIEVTEECAVEHIRFPSTSEGIAEAFVRLRVLFGAGRVDLSRASDQLVDELKETTGRPTPGGGFVVSHKRRAGSHGDCARAFVSAIYSLELGGNAAFRSSAPMTGGKRRMQRTSRYPEHGDRPGYMSDLPPRR